MPRFAIAIVFAVLAVPISGMPQDSPRGDIRVSTRLVEIGVIVRDKNGPVEDLRKEDFTVLDRGKPQEISVFSVESGTPASEPGQALPRNTFSDLPQFGTAKPRSVVVVLLDNLNTLYGSTAESQWKVTPHWLEDLALRNAKTRLIQFIEQLQPEDRVAIYGLRHSLYVLCDFTSDRDQLLAILKRYDTTSVTNRQVVEPSRTIISLDGHEDRMADIFTEGNNFEDAASLSLAGAANQDRGAETMAALRQIAGHVANIPGRKNLVWLTANLPFSGPEMARVLSPANIAVYPVDARGLLSASPALNADMPGTADADDVSGASGRWDNMPAQSSQPIGIATMQELANQTGGQAFVNTNDLTGAIRKAVEDSAVTYTLGFYIKGDSLDGKFHSLEVQTRRKGLTVRYPRGYFALPDTAPSQNEDLRMLATALQSPVESSMIPLKAVLDRANQPPAGGALNLTCWIDVRGVELQQSRGLRKGEIIVYVIGQNAAGRVLHQWHKAYDLQIKEDQYTALLKSEGMPFKQTVDLRPDITTLRVVVEDPNSSALGSLIIPLSQVN